MAMKRTVSGSFFLSVVVLIFFSSCTASSLDNEEGREESEVQEQPAVPAQPARSAEAPARLEQAPPTLEDMQNAFRQVADVVTPVVVQINVVQVVEQQIPQFTNPFEFLFGPEDPQQPREFRRPGLGSGVIVRQDRNSVYVLTNNHVVGQAAR
jgi:serine protease Do